MTNIFDITAFGAIGDGVTDNTAAIQAALNAAAECRGVVRVPPGNYMTGKLKMGKGVSLEGHSAWSFRSYGSSVFTLNTTDTDCLLDITGAFGCAIRGMSLNGCGLGQGVHGVKLYWDQYNGGSEEDTPTIDDCRIGNFSGNAVHLEHIWCFSIRHSMLCFSNAGLYIDGWDGFIMDNWFSGNRNCGLLGGPCAESITATGNRVEWNSVAGFSLKNGRSVNMTGNFFDRTFGPAIQLGKNGRYHDCTITGNVFRRNGCPDRNAFESEYENSHVYLENVYNITLTGNSFEWGVNDNQSGTKSPNYDVYLANSTAVVIQSNVMHEGAIKKSIVYDGKGNNVIRDNLAHN